MEGIVSPIVFGEFRQIGIFFIVIIEFFIFGAINDMVYRFHVFDLVFHIGDP